MSSDTEPQAFERLDVAVTPFIGASAASPDPPLWMQNASYGAVRDRELVATLWSPGVRGPTNLLVAPRAAGANLSVDVAAGQCVIAGTDTPTQMAYLARNAAGINLPINGPPPAGQTRIDRIVARVYDTAVIGGSVNGWTIEVVEGTAAVSPAPPAVPASALALARVSVPAGLAAVAAANITDDRVYWGGPGAAWTPYTPDWSTTGTGAVQPVLGNGTLIGRYCLITPKLCAVYLQLNVGSTTNPGRMGIQFGLPYPGNGAHRNVLNGYCLSAGRYFPGFGVILSSVVWPFYALTETTARSGQARNADATGAVNTGVPASPTTVSFIDASQIFVSGVYEIA